MQTRVPSKQTADRLQTAAAHRGQSAQPLQRMAARVMQLQRMIGNQNMFRMLSGMDQGPSNEQVHQAALEGVKTPAGALPFADRIQASFGGHDISSVQAHRGADAAESAVAMGAAAYATGNHVVFGQTPDLFTAAHEAAHIVQQRNGITLNGGVGAEGDRYEQHANAVASKVVSGQSAEQLLTQMTPLETSHQTEEEAD